MNSEMYACSTLSTRKRNYTLWWK